MNALLKLFVIAALFMTGCNDTQDPTSRIYDEQVNPNLTKTANYSGDIAVGPEAKKVPIHITWSAGKDSDGCLKIVDIQVNRTGGDPTLVVSSVKHTLLPDCAMEWESKDETRFQIASIYLEYTTYIGIKKYSFKGGVASIQGNGKFIGLEK